MADLNIRPVDDGLNKPDIVRGLLAAGFTPAEAHVAAEGVMNTFDLYREGFGEVLEL